MRIRIEVLESDVGEEAEVIAVNGGHESAPIVIGGELGQTEIEVKAPKAVVIREKYVAPEVG